MPDAPVWITTDAGTAGSVWVRWLGEDATATALTSTATTTTWASTTTTTSSTTTAHYAYQQVRQQQTIRQRELAEQENQAAEQRARELLIEHLTVEQRRTLLENRYFIVIGSARGRYRINANGGIAGNVNAINDRFNLCAHIGSSGIPFSDHLLAQKLWLEHDEPGFRRIANASRY